MGTNLGVDIPVLWTYVKQVREATRAILKHYPEDICDATSMVASELVANAIKYGESIPAAPNAKFNLTTNEGIIRIEVTNGTLSQNNIDNVRNRIEEISTTQNKDELYLSCLQAASSGQSKFCHLGLYRIWYEGNFELTYRYESHVLTVIATRKLS